MKLDIHMFRFIEDHLNLKTQLPSVVSIAATVGSDTSPTIPLDLESTNPLQNPSLSPNPNPSGGRWSS